MIALDTCREAAERISDYVDQALPPAERAALENHLRGCAACRQVLARYRDVQGLLSGAFQPGDLRGDFEQETGRRLKAVAAAPAAALAVSGAADVEARPAAGLFERLGGAPWWAVSVALHALVIVLLGLITMTIGSKAELDAVVVLTSLDRNSALKPVEDTRPKAEKRDIFAAKHDTPATDPDSTVASNILVPPDILAQAELGDHFETINPDRPDTHSAFGNPEAKMFHSVSGSDDVEGGGGMGGQSLLDDLIGVGGSASPGSGGGWGGGTGTGIGVGTGAGHGSFGQRSGGGRRLMVLRHGGSKATESAVDAGLEWLVRHQNAEGFWQSELYNDNTHIRHGGGPGTVKTNTVGVSALAILAFLGAGHSTRVGKYKDNVKRGVAWLLKNQAADGHLGVYNTGGGCSISSSYCHHIATLALCEAYAMGGNRETSFDDLDKDGKPKGNGLREAVEKAVGLSYQWQDQNPQGGWSYGAANPIDPTVTGWAVMALKSAKVAGLPVPAQRFEKAIAALKTITTIDKSKGDYGHAVTGYRSAGAKAFGSKGYACTAAGMVANLFLGADRAESGVDAAAAYITQDEALPAWIFKADDPTTDHQNLYYWYYGTLGCFQAGGDVWKRWNEKMKTALVPNQRKENLKDGSPQDVDGSWDPNDVWGAWGGRVYSTALATLSLEVYYRYLPLYK